MIGFPRHGMPLGINQEGFRMAFLEVHFFSDTLNVESTVNVILPEGNQGIGVTAASAVEPPKVLYLLHGYSDDHTIWMRRTSVERYAAPHNLAVIMPAVNHSYYCNEAYGERYWDYVSDELPRAMHRFLRLSDRPEDTYVAGLSMGGYGAMRLALTYPERFAQAASFSGAVDMISELAAAPAARQERWRSVLGDLEKAPGSEVDLMYLMRRNADAPKKPRLYVSCGTADFLYDQHQRFVPALRENGWNVTSYEEPDVPHSWAFWDAQIKTFIGMIFPKQA